MNEHETQTKEAFYSDITATLERYEGRFPDEAERLAELKKQLANPAIDIRLRSTIPEGHMCASGILLLPGNKVLMLEHKALGIWVVPGGHYDIEDGEIANAAIRETMEETGIDGVTLHPWHVENGMPLDIDTHPIPRSEKKNEDAHQHFDFRYVLVAGNPDSILDRLNLDTAEVLNFNAIPIEEIDQTSSIAPAIRKLHLLAD